MITRCSLPLALATCASSRGPALKAAEAIDLGCFVGPWRIIACVDNAVEHEVVDAVTTYALRDDGQMEVHSRWREKSFSAPEKTHDAVCQVTDGSAQASWSTQLFPLLKTSYTIIGVQPQYEWAAVAHPSRKLGWILARARGMEARTYRDILRLFEQQGYDTERFIKIPQLVMQRSYSMHSLPMPSFRCA
ncbi:MAG: lipocalin family protein [Verrucomicrobiota bacterium]